MNGYLALGLLSAFIAWSGFMYYEGHSREADACAKAAQQKELVEAKVAEAAQKGVIATVAKQQNVTNGVDHDYQVRIADIDNDYADEFKRLASVQQPQRPAATNNNLSASAIAAVRPVIAASRPFRTKVYKLNAQECDANTAQLYGLQAWLKGQLAIKQPTNQQ